jgi:hypothetical protein
MEKDGSLRSIYCHWDGYLAYNGVILATSYDTEEKVRELISLGGISSLNETLDKTISYHNWRGEEIVIETHKDINELFYHFTNSWEEYLYVFKDNKWYYAENFTYYGEKPELLELKPTLSEKGLI